MKDRVKPFLFSSEKMMKIMYFSNQRMKTVVLSFGFS